MTGLRLVSLVTGVMSIIVGALYLGPESWVRRPPLPNQTSIVQRIESAGPVWPALFVVTGLILLVAAVRGRALAVAHIAAVFAWATYGAALYVGAVQSEPPSPIVTAYIVIGVSWIHFALAVAHRKDAL